MSSYFQLAKAGIKDLQFRPLKSRRHKIRAFARTAFMRARGDKDHAVELASADIEDHFGSAILTYILIKLAIALAIKLIEYWIEQKLETPALSYQDGEPGANL